MPGSLTVYLISGANRGLGLGFVKQILAAKEEAFVFAGVRTPERTSELNLLADAYPDRVKIIKCVSADVEGNAALAREIAIRYGRVDTVIANAGICKSMAGATDVSVGEMEADFHVNVVGTIVLFQAVCALLKKSTCPRFIPISSASGCIDNDLIKLPVGMMSYGASKAALNWATRKIHFENDWLVAFPLSPGTVDTEMLHHNIQGDTSGIFKRMADASPDFPTSVAAATSLLKIIDASTRENEGGQFVHVDGSRLAW